MKAIFYDRKNKREVSNDQLMPINLVEEYAGVDSDGPFVSTGLRLVHGEILSEENFHEAKAKGFFKEEALIWEKLPEVKNPKVFYPQSRQVSSLGYKSEKCSQHLNYDLHTNLENLVFLRLEENGHTQNGHNVKTLFETNKSDYLKLNKKLEH